MRTPPLRRRVTRIAILVLVGVLLAFNAFVYVSMREGLEGSLEELLSARMDVATSLAVELREEEGLEGEELASTLAEGLSTLGVPAAVHSPEGDRFESEPATPRVGGAGPATALAGPRGSVTERLPGGTVVEVFVTRAGVEESLRRLLLVLAVGTLGAFALAYGLLRHATSRALAPLAEVADTAERITGGASGERLRPDRATTELGRMASAFDEMVGALEVALDRAEQEREHTRRFLADAAHQLRTPITGVRATTELLLQETDPEVRDRLLANAIRETVRAGRLVSALLHMAQLDQGPELQRTPTDLVELCRSEVERARDFAPHLDVALEVAEPAPEPVVVDPHEVQDALANLVDNARRHAHSQLRVVLSGADGEILVRIQDDGPGLPEGAEELVFERFTSLDGQGGSGLGLPIARAVARAHGGDLACEDGAFVLRLPARTSG